MQDVFCSTKPILAKGAAAHPLLHTPSPWLFQGVEPIPEPVDRIAGQPLAGLGEVPLHLHRTMHERLAVQLPIRGAFLLPPIPPMTISWRRLHRDQEGSFRATLTLDPSHRAGAFGPLHPRRNGRAISNLKTLCSSSHAGPLTSLSRPGYRP